MIQLVKPKTKYHPTLTSDKYAYGEVLHIVAESSIQPFEKLKPVKRLK